MHAHLSHNILYAVEEQTEIKKKKKRNIVSHLSVQLGQVESDLLVQRLNRNTECTSEQRTAFVL